MKNNNTLNGKDFINIGIFTAIYMVIVIAIACTVGLIPIGFILLPVILPIIGGIPMMLYFTKIKKPGMLLIFEILYRAVHYQSANMAIFVYGVLSTCICGNNIQWISASQDWLDMQAATYGDTYVTNIHGFMTTGWGFPAMIVGAFVAGVVGGLIGKRVVKKHFEKSGLV